MPKEGYSANLVLLEILSVCDNTKIQMNFGTSLVEPLSLT